MSEEPSSKSQTSSRIAGNVGVRRLGDVASGPLPQRIVDWAEDLRLGHSEIVPSELTGRSAPQITVEEAALACKHDLVPVFEFLTSRVRPRHEVQLIRNTLDAALNRPELAKLPKFRRLIQRRQARLKDDELKDKGRRESALHAAGQLRQLRELQRECMDIIVDLERADRDVTDYRASVADKQRRIVTLETFQSTLDPFSQRIDEYSDVLNKAASRCQPETIPKPDDPSSSTIRSYLESSVDPTVISADVQGIVQSSLSTTQDILYQVSQKAETEVVVAVQELRGIVSGAEANELRSGSMDALGDMAQTHVDRVIEVEDLRRKAARTKGEVEVRIRQTEQLSQFRRSDTERRVHDKVAIDLHTFKLNYLRALEAKHTRIQEVWSPVNDLWWRMQSAEQNLRSFEAQIASKYSSILKLWSKHIEETSEADERATPRLLQELQKVRDTSGTFLTARTKELRTFGDLNLDAFTVSDTSPSPQPTVTLAIDRSRRSKALGHVVEALGLRYSYQLPDELELHIKHLRIIANRLAQIAVALDGVPDLTKRNFLEEQRWATISHDTLPDWDGMLFSLLSKLKDLLLETDTKSISGCSRTIQHQERLHQESKEIVLDLRSIITRDAV